MAAPERLRVAFACLAAAAGLLAAPLGAEDRGHLASTQKFLATAAGRVLIEDLAGKRLEQTRAACQERLSGDPARFRVPGANLAQLEAAYDGAFTRAATELLDEVYRRYRGPAGEEPYFARDPWVAALVESPGRQAVKANRKRYFLEVAEAARQGAVADQRRRLGASAYPSAEQVEALDRQGWSEAGAGRLLASIRERMAGAIQAEALFQEVEAEVDRMAQAAIADARVQLESQRALVANPHGLPGDALTAATLAGALRRALDQWIAIEKARRPAGQEVYGIFPSVLSSLPARGAEIEMDLLATFAARHPWAPAARDIEARLRREPARHRGRAQSLDALAADLSGAFLDASVTAHASRLPEAADRQAFARHLLERLRAEGEAGSRLALLLRGRIEGPLDQVRAALARAQLEELFPAVARGTWYPDEMDLEPFMREAGGRLVDGPVVSSIDTCLALRRIATRSRIAPGELWEETAASLLAACNRLLAEGSRAWRGQVELIDRHQGEIARDVDVLVRTAAATEPEAAMAAITRTLLAKYEGAWEKVRMDTVWPEPGARPANASWRYPSLFRAARDRIRQLVRERFPVAAARTQVAPSTSAGAPAKGEEPPSVAAGGTAAVAGGDGAGQAVSPPAGGSPVPRGGGRGTVAGADAAPGGRGGGWWFLPWHVPVPWWVLLLLALMVLAAWLFRRRLQRAVDISFGPDEAFLVCDRFVRDLGAARAFYEEQRLLRLEHVSSRQVLFRVAPGAWLRLHHWRGDAGPPPPTRLQLVCGEERRVRRHLTSPDAPPAHRELHLFDPEGLCLDVVHLDEEPAPRSPRASATTR